MDIPSENQISNIEKTTDHDWLISTSEVAKYFGVNASTIRQHKRRYAGEITEGRHFIVTTIRNPSLKSFKRVLWTKAGITRLSFFIISDNSRKFRDLAEGLMAGPSFKKQKQ